MVGCFQKKKNVQIQTETAFHLSQVAGQESLKKWAWRVPHIQSIWSRWESPPSSSWILEPSNINWIWILSCSQCNQCSQASVEDHEGEDGEQKYRESIFCTSSCCTRKVTPSVADDWSQASEQDKHQVPQRKPSFISKHNEMEKKEWRVVDPAKRTNHRKRGLLSRFTVFTCYFVYWLSKVRLNVFAHTCHHEDQWRTNEGPNDVNRKVTSCLGPKPCWDGIHTSIETRMMMI